MADSEISRTLTAIIPEKEVLKETPTKNLPPLIDRRNLLSVAARILSACITETNGKPRASGPTPVREMWSRWYACHHQRVQATRHRQKLENKMLEEAGSLPIVEIDIVGNDRPTVVRSLSDINGLTSNLDAEQLHQVRAELYQRRKRWRKADQRVGYTLAVVREQELAERSGIMGRVMWITKPSTLIEVTAKLHCLIVMNDPALKLNHTPWPELRTILKDLIRIAGTPGRGHGPRAADNPCGRYQGVFTPCKRAPGVDLASPGGTASARQLLNLAERYKDAAINLGEASSQSNHIPQRLLALHSIELYLNALLLAKGVDHEAIRGVRHDLGERTRIAINLGLVLRKRTAAHLMTPSLSNEYFAVRYVSTLSTALSQVNRVMATLSELSQKVPRLLKVKPCQKPVG